MNFIAAKLKLEESEQSIRLQLDFLKAQLETNKKINPREAIAKLLEIIQAVDEKSKFIMAFIETILIEIDSELLTDKGDFLPVTWFKWKNGLKYLNSFKKIREELINTINNINEKTN